MERGKKTRCGRVARTYVLQQNRRLLIKKIDKSIIPQLLFRSFCLVRRFIRPARRTLCSPLISGICATRRMMLASPLLPAPMFSQDESMHYRPSKDMDAFNNLLPPPIQFVEGSSSGTLAVAEGRYEPINASPKLPKPEVRLLCLLHRLRFLHCI